MAAAEPHFPEVAGLEAFWTFATGRATATWRIDRPVRVMLDMLGLGFEQVLTELRQNRPDWPAFVRWIAETAGLPDRAELARYHAMLRGDPPPLATRARLDAITAMTPVLDEADLAHWQREGYVVLRAAITPEQAAAAAALVWRLVGGRTGDPASWYDWQGNGVMLQHFQDPALEPVRRNARVHKAFAQLWGTADLWSIIDRVGFNPPVVLGHPYRGHEMHWDCSLARPIPFSTLGVLYLTDTEADQGALRLVPGFHHRLDDWLDSLGGADPCAQNLDHLARHIPGKAGDLIIWRHDLPHGASPNSSDRPRLVQYANMYPVTWADREEWV
ncbi:MAG: phytanoyl-CoA dioxygenase family protein [Sphingomonadales bacterium]|nr:phytanoyl-CoA dioxygenase family protein [Sphingomonadales bacterium]